MFFISARKIAQNMYSQYHRLKTKWNTFSVPISNLLRGGENGIRAAKYAELTNDFLRPSTSVLEGPHVKLLQLYNEIGDALWQDEVFTNTHYYKNALECMRLTGAYFYDKPEKIKTLATRFIAQFKGEKLELPRQPGQSDANQPVWVRPIKHSSCYEVIDGNHRIARAIMNGHKHIDIILYDKEPVLTPLQQLLLDVLWINKKKWLYQPIDFPELKDQWTLVRKCSDRLKMMQQFLLNIELANNPSYIDIGSSYGWFVNAMQQQGFNAFGLERDPFGIDVGIQVYGIKKEQIIHQDVVLGMEKLINNNVKYDVVSCLSVLHHFVLNKSSTSAQDFIKLIDGITKKVLFIDTGEEHENAFGNSLKGWNPQFIRQWLLENTSFKEVIPLGIDDDRKAPFLGYYNRTLFACVK